MKLHLAHILVAHQYEAEDVLRLLARGESFVALARKYSICPSASGGGDLGEIEQTRLEKSFDADFVAAALTLAPLQTSGAVRSRFGYHLIRRLA